MLTGKMNDSLIRNVSDTAFMAAAYRAIESERPDALFHDPLASHLCGQQGMRIVAGLPKKVFIGGWTVVIRTRVIDEQLQSAIAGGIDTIVNLGAGLDTRPYRMDLPDSLHWIEIDYPHIIELKETVLRDEKPRCRLERIKLDLADRAARQGVLAKIAAGSGNILVLTEAVIPYLAEDIVASIAGDLRAHPAIKYWIVDYFSPEAHRYRQKNRMDQLSAPFLFGPRDYFGFFAGLGWRPKEIRYLAKEADRFNRPPSFPAVIQWFTRVMGLFMSRERREEMKKFTGYVLFEPSAKTV